MKDKWVDFEYLYHQALGFDRRQGGAGAFPTKEDFRRFIEQVQRVSAELHVKRPDGSEAHALRCEAYAPFRDRPGLYELGRVGRRRLK